MLKLVYGAKTQVAFLAVMMAVVQTPAVVMAAVTLINASVMVVVTSLAKSVVAILVSVDAVNPVVTQAAGMDVETVVVMAVAWIPAVAGVTSAILTL
jgi:hypothetical protein